MGNNKAWAWESPGFAHKKRLCQHFDTTSSDIKTYQISYYNLDMIISVGYRVKLHRGVQFRMWATQVLREYLVKGFSKYDKFKQRTNA